MLIAFPERGHDEEEVEPDHSGTHKQQVLCAEPVDKGMNGESAQNIAQKKDINQMSLNK
jgi:hypothetical protein